MPKTIVITGGNSYLGNFISEYLAENSDFQLKIIHSHRTDNKKFIKNENVENFKADLSCNLSSEIKKILSCADKVFHFAWIRGKNTDLVYQQNKKMIAQLLENISKPEKLFFISSVSGTPNAKSEYGKNKYKALKWLEKENANSIILGLVMEKKPAKGPYSMLQKIAKKLPIAFRINKHEPLVFPIHKQQFAQWILEVAKTEKANKKYAFFEQPVGFNEFMSTVENQFPRKRLKLKMNARFLLKSASLAKKSKLFPVKICDQLLTFFYKDNDFLLQDELVRPA